MMKTILGRKLIEQTAKHAVVEMIATCFETFTSEIEFRILVDLVVEKPTLKLISTLISTRKEDGKSLIAGTKKRPEAAS